MWKCGMNKERNLVETIVFAQLLFVFIRLKQILFLMYNIYPFHFRFEFKKLELSKDLICI